MTWEVWAPSLGMDRDGATMVEGRFAGEAAVNWVEKRDPSNDCVVGNSGELVVNVVERGPDNYSTWRVTGEPRYYYKATLTGGS